jgi:hypothetical protein
MKPFTEKDLDELFTKWGMNFYIDPTTKEEVMDWRDPHNKAVLKLVLKELYEK